MTLAEMLIIGETSDYGNEGAYTQSASSLSRSPQRHRRGVSPSLVEKAMAECYKCEKTVNASLVCDDRDCPVSLLKDNQFLQDSDNLLQDAVNSRVFAFGEDHKYDADVDFVACLLLRLIRRGAPVIFLLEVATTEAPDNLLDVLPVWPSVPRGQKPVHALRMLGLDEDEQTADFEKFKRRWSGVAEENGCLVQIPFLMPECDDESSPGTITGFAIQACFHELSEGVHLRAITDEEWLLVKAPKGTTDPKRHKRNAMLRNLADANGITAYGIDLPGGNPDLWDPVRVQLVASASQRFQLYQYWNMLRDTWMAKMILEMRARNPAATICVFTGADHFNGLRNGGRPLNFSFYAAAESGEKKENTRSVDVTGGTRLNGTDCNAIYLQPRPYSEQRETFRLQNLIGDERTY